MNRESLNVNNISKIEALEEQGKPSATLENKENVGKFAESVIGKIRNYMNFFVPKKEALEEIESSISFDDSTIKEQIKNEINLDNELDEIDRSAEAAENEACENINAIIHNFSKRYHHSEYRKETARQIMEARNLGQDPEAVRSRFCNRTAMEKENFELQEQERSVAEIMKKKDLMVVHAIPLTPQDRKSTQGNNPVLKSNGYQDFRTSIEILLGLCPTISTSIPSVKKNQNGLYYPSGVILGEGRILSAEPKDSGSVAYGLYKRIPKFGVENRTAIQPEINIDKVMEDSPYYNELTVENPQIAGLFYDLTQENFELPLEDPKKNLFIDNIKRYSKKEMSEEEIQGEIEKINERWKNYVEEKRKENQQKEMVRKFQLNTMKKYSEEMSIPLYVFKKENNELKKYRIKFLPKEEGSKMVEESDYTLEEVTVKDIYESRNTILSEERKKMVEDIKNKGILSDLAEKEIKKRFLN